VEPKAASPRTAPVAQAQVFPEAVPVLAAPARAIRDTAMEGSDTIARGMKKAVPRRVRSAATKGLGKWYFGLGAAGLLLAGTIILWAAGVFGGKAQEENGSKPSADGIVAKVKEAGGIDLVAIPAGEFYMGSKPDDKDAKDREKPRHKVRISKPFYLGKYKVTVGQFQRFVKATDYQTEAEKAGDDETWKKPGFDQTDEHPVVCVSWNDAAAFCKWLAKETGAKVRLPREAEWEYCCRAKTTTKFYFGDDEADLGAYAWYTKNTNDKGTKSCGLKKPNNFGLYDMHGLAWEWCDDGKRTYKDQDETDPVGPAGSSRVVRGGSWNCGPRDCRAAIRFDDAPSNRHGLNGFRVLVVR
jgi:formylglycine-generating enzyme required for sulfatase activity